MPESPQVRFRGRGRAASVTGDRGRLTGKSDLPPLPPRPKPEHRISFSKARAGRTTGNPQRRGGKWLHTEAGEPLYRVGCRCGWGSWRKVTRQQGRQMYQQHVGKG